MNSFVIVVGSVLQIYQGGGKLLDAFTGVIACNLLVGNAMLEF